MKAPFYSTSGEKTKESVLPKDVFDLEVKPELLHQVVVAQQANQRLVIASTKDRSEVSGGGRKPWRQKGTGRARHGSIRSPIWVGGGVTFGPSNARNFGQKINRQMARKGLLGAMTSKAKDEQVAIIEDMIVKEGKTKEVASVIKSLPFEGSILLVVPKQDKLLRQSLRNIPKLRATTIDQLTAWQILAHRYLVLTKTALSELKDSFSKS
jgi:large subunit ribosomal protein L4